MCRALRGTAIVAWTVVLAAGAVAAPVIKNGTFEEGAEAPFPGYGSIDQWDCVRKWSGVNRSGGPFWNNGSLCYASRCAFVQSNERSTHAGDLESIYQYVPGFEAGKEYDLRIRVNARELEPPPGFKPEPPSIEVSLGTTVILPATPIRPVGGPAGAGNPFRQLETRFTSPGRGLFRLTIQNTEGRVDSALLIEKIEIVDHVTTAPEPESLVWLSDLETARKVAKETPCSILVYCERPGDPQAARVWSEVLQLPEIRAVLEKGFILAKIDEKALRGVLGSSGSAKPTELIVCRQSGEFLDRIDASLPTKNLLLRLQANAFSPCAGETKPAR